MKPHVSSVHLEWKPDSSIHAQVKKNVTATIFGQLHACFNQWRFAKHKARIQQQKPHCCKTVPTIYNPIRTCGRSSCARTISTKQKTRCQFANSIVLVHHDQSCFSMFGISKLTHLAHESAQPCGSAVNLPNFGGCFLGWHKHGNFSVGILAGGQTHGH